MQEGGEENVGTKQRFYGIIAFWSLPMTDPDVISHVGRISGTPAWPIPRVWQWITG